MSNVSSTTCSVYKVPNGDGQCRAAKVIDHSALPELIRDSHLPDELAIIRSVRHPNIILTDAILTKLPNYSIIISEFAREGDLTRYIEKTGIDPPDVNLSKKGFRVISNALVWLHQKFIAHRDIKLDNILLFEELTAKLCDFGFATYCRDQKTRAHKCYARPSVAPLSTRRRRYFCVRTLTMA